VTDLAGFSKQLRTAPTALLTAQKRALRTSTFGMGASVRATTAAAAPGGRLNVGRKGSKVGVKVRVNASGTQGYVNARGPYQLIERDTAAHTEPRISQTSRRRRRQKALKLPGIGFRKSVRHPGTHGKHPFKAGIEEFNPQVPRIFERELHRAMQRTFR
jgi:hypothetical protein